MPSFKRIKDYDKLELDQAVEAAVDHCAKDGFSFWTVLNGIDAYLERRRRKEELEEAAKGDKVFHKGMGDRPK